MRMTLEDVHGVFAIMPTPATPDAADWRATRTVQLDESSRAAAALAESGVSAVMGTGTLGEGPTLTRDELVDFARAVVAGVDGRCPVLLGATALGTRETIQRAEALADAGVDGFLMGRPMWCAMGPAAIVDYYAAIAEALPELAIVVYDNPVAFRGKIPVATYRELAEIPQVVAAKYTLITSQYFEDVKAAGDGMVLLPIDFQWYYAWRIDADRAPGCWSSGASCGPHPVLALQAAIERGDSDAARAITDELKGALSLCYPNGSVEAFLQHNIAINKAMYTAGGYIDPGPVRPPYHLAPADYVECGTRAGRQWATLQEKYAATPPGH